MSENTQEDILIAGASGVIGTSLFKTLYQNHSVTGLYNSNTSIIDGYHQLDLNSKEKIETFVSNHQKFKILIFLVGLAHKKATWNSKKIYRKINKDTLINLLSILEKYNKLPSKIIYASTISVYGERINENIYFEGSNKSPYSPYATTKLEAEQFLLNNYKNKSWILRLSPVYSNKFLLNIHRRTRFGKLFYRIGNGLSRLSLCNIENIGLVIEKIINDKVPSGVYNISDSVEYNYNDLHEYLGSEMIIKIPNSLIKILYKLGMLAKNTFLIENTIKLVSDNVFCSKKIQKYVALEKRMNVK
tara:strand:- start:3911 stop:4816 length:906 start_codon:yes stop_codon:yes gene_type:complete